MADPVVNPESVPDNMDALLTTNKVNLVGAINENVVNIAKTKKVVHLSIGLAGPVAGPTLPTGAKIIGYHISVGVAYPTGATITIGDHSGALGALAATSIVTAAGTATAQGEYSAVIFKTPVGALSVSIAGGNGSTGAAEILIDYIDA